MRPTQRPHGIRRRAWPAAVLAPALVGCGGTAGDGSGGPAVSVRDSAGVRIVESRSPQWAAGTAWTVSAEPSVVIGAVEGEPGQQLYEVGDVAELSDGRIVVVNAGTELRYFGPDGGHLLTAGGEGEGPGEFSSIAGIEVRGDTVFVFDRGLGRLTLLDASGALLGVTTLEASEGGPMGTHGHRLGGLLGDQLVLEAWAFDAGMRDRPTVYWDSLPNLRYGLDGTYLGPAGRYGGMELYAASHRSTFLPFGRLTTSDVREGRFLIGDGAWLGYEAYAPDGRLAAIARASFEREPVTDALFEELVMGPLREAIAAAPPEALESGQADELLAFYESIPLPATRPAYSELVVDAEGNAWLREHQWRGETGATDWHVFGPDDAWLGSVTVPRRLAGSWIGSDHLLGAWTDDLGVEYVLRYEIEKGP